MNIFSSSQPKKNHAVPRHTAARSQARLPAKAAPIDKTYAEESTREGGLVSALFAALFALPVTVLIGFLLLLIVTAVAYANADPDAMTTPLSLAALGLTALMGGMVSAIRGYRQPLLSALLLGVLLILVQLGASLFYDDGMRAQLTIGLTLPLRWGLRLSVVPFALLGGRLGKRPSRDPHRHGQNAHRGRKM